MTEDPTILVLAQETFPMLAVYWLAAEKILKLVQPFLIGFVNRAIARAVETSDTDDDHFIEVVLKSKAWRLIGFLLDLLVRIKLPTAADLDNALKAKQTVKQ